MLKQILYHFNLLSQQKMKRILLLIIVLSILSQVQPRYRPQLQRPLTSPPQTTHQYTQQLYLFDQVTDHSNYQLSTFYKQRYWVINKYFNPTTGPVYIYLCGEWICSGINDERQWIMTLAQKTLGLVIVLEHRFYGESLPFGKESFKIDNMRFLTSQQALSDVAYFIREMNAQQMFGINHNPWITVGGSYPGALSAWFRSKYPHLTIGSIASSAVVQSIQNFSDFDLQMYLSTMKSGDYCQQAINQSNYMVEKILESAQGGWWFKGLFEGGQKLNNNEFLFFWNDAIVMQVQYGSRTSMCNSLKDKTPGQQFDYFFELASQHPVFEQGSYYLKNDTYPEPSDLGGLDRLTARAWYYQSCTEFGYWQTPSSHPLRSQRLGLDFYKKFCADSFGDGTWPKVDRKNTETGGWDLEGTNLFMVNGDQDPWKWASVLHSRDGIIAREADCDDCGHCPELRTPLASDPPQLKKIRDEQFLTIQEWIADYWRKHNQKKLFNSIKPKILSQ